MRGPEVFEHAWGESSVSAYQDGSMDIELSDCADTSLYADLKPEIVKKLYLALKSVFEPEGAEHARQR